MNNTENRIDIALDWATKIGHVFAAIWEKYADWCADRASTEAGVIVLSIMPVILLKIASYFVSPIVIKLLMAAFAFGVLCIAIGIIRFLVVSRRN